MIEILYSNEKGLKSVEREDKIVDGKKEVNLSMNFDNKEAQAAVSTWFNLVDEIKNNELETTEAIISANMSWLYGYIAALKAVKMIDNEQYKQMMNIVDLLNTNEYKKLDKQGGVSDDICEWISVSDGEFIQNPHTRRTFSNEPSMQNVYCNTCGKKIKVVE